VNNAILQLSLLGVLGACGAHSKLNLGGDTDTGAIAPDDSGGANPCSIDAIDAGASDADAEAEAPDPRLAVLVGDWAGFAENGPDSLSLVFSTQADGSIAGTLAFGSGPPPPLPTDPNIGYFPPGIGPLSPGIAQGFRYGVEGVLFDGKRLRFRIQPLDQYEPWCALQTVFSLPPDPVHDPNRHGCAYSCVPFFSSAQLSSDLNANCTLVGRDGTTTIVNCGKFALCGGIATLVCSCSANGCTVNRSGLPYLAFDLVFFSGRLDGSYAEGGGGGGGHNVHFMAPAGDP
jgi:hypothetical protein